MTPQENAVAEALRILSRQADELRNLSLRLPDHPRCCGKSKPVRDHINANALFWNTALHALQSALILALGRVFETSTPHNVSTFMRAMDANRAAFSRAGLKSRKAQIFGDDLAGLNNYVQEARLPRPSDFRRVAKFVKQHRTTYLSTYRALRDQVFAHTLTADRERIAELFSKTNIRQLQRMTTDLGHLHDAFWQAFHNGGRLTLRRRRYSIARMLKRPRGKRAIVPVHETGVAQTRQALLPWANQRRILVLTEIGTFVNDEIAEFHRVLK
jgi:hypothetical protein